MFSELFFVIGRMGNGADFGKKMCIRDSPNSVRIIVQMAIIASLVIVVDQLLRAYAYEVDVYKRQERKRRTPGRRTLS